VPTYEFKCTNGHKFDRYLKLRDYQEPQWCVCGAESTKLISIPMITPSFEAYESPIDGRPITTKKARSEDMKRNGCVPYETGMVENNNQNLRNEELKLEKSLDDTVDSEISKMDSRQHDQLESSLKAGVDLEYNRN